MPASAHSSPSERSAPLALVDDDSPTVHRARPLRTADVVVSTLLEAGVDTFFGVPGGPVATLFDVICHDDRAHLVESRHESGALFAAMGYHRSTGRLPCVLVTAGPGITNAVTGIAAAALEQVPLVVICGDVAWASGQQLLQDSGPRGLDAERMLGKSSRAQFRIGPGCDSAVLTLATIGAATNPEDEGPAVLVVPADEATRDIRPMRLDLGAARPLPMPKLRSVEFACRALDDARRPLLVFGAAARAHAPILEQLVNWLHVPFVCTPRAKGIIDENHPLSLRNGGLAASRWAREYTCRGVDACVVLGTDLDDCSVGPTRYVRDGGTLVHVDRDPSVFGRSLPTTLGVVADVGAVATCMLQVSTRLELGGHPVASEVATLRKQTPFDEPDFDTDARDSIAPHRALADLQTAAGRNAWFVTDIGEHMLFALHYLTARSREDFSIHLGLGSMGSGVCSAIGLALGDRQRRVVCVCGDGSMAMFGGEVLVAVEERLPVVFCVFNDARYNMVYHGHQDIFGRSPSWSTPQVDFESWGRALGLATVTIRHPGEISAQLLDALLASGPALLDVRIDSSVHFRGGGRNEALVKMSLNHTQGANP